MANPCRVEASIDGFHALLLHHLLHVLSCHGKRARDELCARSVGKRRSLLHNAKIRQQCLSLCADKSTASHKEFVDEGLLQAPVAFHA